VGRQVAVPGRGGAGRAAHVPARHVVAGDGPVRGVPRLHGHRPLGRHVSGAMPVSAGLRGRQRQRQRRRRVSTVPGRHLEPRRVVRGVRRRPD
jgi:hypothetical protein